MCYTSSGKRFPAAGCCIFRLFPELVRAADRIFSGFFRRRCFAA
jgi:hypothetical protein